MIIVNGQLLELPLSNSLFGTAVQCGASHKHAVSQTSALSHRLMNRTRVRRDPQVDQGPWPAAVLLPSGCWRCHHWVGSGALRIRALIHATHPLTHVHTRLLRSKRNGRAGTCTHPTSPPARTPHTALSLLPDCVVTCTLQECVQHVRATFRGSLLVCAHYVPKANVSRVVACELLLETFFTTAVHLVLSRRKQNDCTCLIFRDASE